MASKPGNHEALFAVAEPDSDTVPPESGNRTDAASPGIARIEAINRHITRTDRTALLVGIFLLAYAYGLDGQIRSTYQASLP